MIRDTALVVRIPSEIKDALAALARQKGVRSVTYRILPCRNFEPSPARSLLQRRATTRTILTLTWNLTTQKAKT